MPVCQWYVLQEGQDPLTIWLAERYHGAFALAVRSLLLPSDDLHSLCQASESSPGRPLPACQLRQRRRPNR